MLLHSYGIILLVAVGCAFECLQYPTNRGIIDATNLEARFSKNTAHAFHANGRDGDMISDLISPMLVSFSTSSLRGRLVATVRVPVLA